MTFLEKYSILNNNNKRKQKRKENIMNTFTLINLTLALLSSMTILTLFMNEQLRYLRTKELTWYYVKVEEPKIVTNYKVFLCDVGEYEIIK